MEKITKGEILFLFEQMQKKVISKHVFLQEITDKSDLPLEDINVPSLLTTLRKLKKKDKAKTPDSRLTYRNEYFTIPLHKVAKPPTDTFEFVSQQMACDLHQTRTELQSVIDRKSKEVEDILKKKEHVSAKLKSTQETVKQTVKKLKRRDSKIECLQTELKKLKETNDIKTRSEITAQRTVARCKKSLEVKTRYLRLARAQNVSLKKENRKMKLISSSNEILTSQLQGARAEIQALTTNNKELSDKVKEVDTSLQYLELLLHDNRERESEIKLFDEEKKCFSTPLMECVMNLDNLNVANKNIPQVIKEVLTLANCTANRLPSRSTIDNIISAKKVVTEKQLSKVAPGMSHTTLYSDETSKFGKTYNVFAITDEKKEPLLLGLRDMSNKSSKTTLDTFKEILSDISLAHDSGEGTSVGTEILSRIANTMSDRAATEVAFNRLLAEYRTELLPDIVQHWDSLGEHQKPLMKLNNFFCGLHLLVHFAEVASKAIHKFECLHAQTSASDRDSSSVTESHHVSEDVSSEAQTIQFLRACSKCFSRGGDERNGCYAKFKTYCDSKNQKVLFVRFRGNRFNIVFLMGQILFFQKERIVDFFENYHEPSNALQKEVVNGVKKPIVIAAARVLGLISKLISAPLWRILESKINILDMNSHYKALLEYLDKVSQDASTFLNGTSFPFDEELLEQDEVFQQLTKSDETDQLALTLAQCVCLALKELLSSMVKEHLPGGQHWVVSEQKQKESASVIPHNKLPEFVFGQLDFLLRYRPNASTIVNEAFVMYSMNKTSEWLRGLDEREKQELLASARKEGRLVRARFMERCKAIEEDRLRRMEAKKRETEERQARVLAKKQKLTEGIVYHGLWQTRHEVEEYCKSFLKASDLRDALKAQLLFRKNVLKQSVSDKQVYALSKKKETGKYQALSVKELKENLLTLIEQAQLKHTEEETSSNRPLLCGRRVCHTFSDAVYTGKVISVVPGYPEWYNIVYDGDAAVYSYKLQDDYRDGNLEIIA